MHLSAVWAIGLSKGLYVLFGSTRGLLFTFEGMLGDKIPCNDLFYFSTDLRKTYNQLNAAKALA